MFTLDMPTILQYGWAGKQWAIRDDMRDYSKLEWSDVSEKPTEQAMLDAELAAAKAARITKAKSEAMTRIYATYPAWMQTNCALGAYDEGKTAAIKAGINAVRSAEEAAEVAINALEAVQAVIDFTW
jgi:hypothetical protein